MRTYGEVRQLLDHMANVVNVQAKRRLDRKELRAIIAMVSTLEWVLQRQDDSSALKALAQAEIDNAGLLANRDEE